LEQLKYYIRPELYGAEQEDYDHKNVLFHKQSHVGRALGATKSPKGVRSAINKFYETMEKPDANRVHMDMNDLDENTVG
jgi:hypothetical protein